MTDDDAIMTDVRAAGTITESAPRRFADPLPDAADAVVIGGGVIGVSTAFFLAEHGLKVVVCEKGRIAGEQSSRNWGWVRQMGRDPDELPIMMEANRIWRGLADRTGEDFGFAVEGAIYLAETEEEQAANEKWLEVARQHQLDTRAISGRQVEELIDGRPGLWAGGLYTPSDGRAEPWQAVPALARAAQRLGAVIAEDCAVRTVDLKVGGVAGVATENGRIRCNRVVLAGGAWSALFAGNMGIRLPQLIVSATVARTAPAPNVYAGNAGDSRFDFRRRADGGYTIASGGRHTHFLGPKSFRYLGLFVPSLRVGWQKTRIRPAAPRDYPDAWATPRHWWPDDESPFERIRVLNPKPAPGAVARMRRDMDARLPALRDVEIVESWAGMIDTMPDVVPVIDEVPNHAGLFIATGFSGHGFGIGPGVGRVVADLVQGRPPGHDLARFRFSRFTDGSPIDLGPAL